MTAVVVLGMHRAGTSLMASMLDAMGVHMGDELMKPHPEFNPNGFWEDLDFLHLNMALLRDAGGDWRNVPDRTALNAAKSRMKPAITQLLAGKRQDGLWGWKDPRTSLTAGLFHEHLDNPHYIVIRRDRPDVVDSLTRRDGPGMWGELYDLYQQRIGQFLSEIDAPVFVVRYEDLTHPKAAPMRVKEMAAFLGLDDTAADRALERIEYRDRWGFGTIGIGVPYYKASYPFFRWWSWLLVGGLEPHDQLLNNANLRCEVPIPMAHNGLVVEFLKGNRDTLCIVEDDHVGPQDVIREMRLKEENQRFDIVCASYVNRRPPLVAVGFDFASMEPNEYGEFECVVEPFKVAEEGTQEYDGAVLGLVLIRRWVLEQMQGDQALEDTFWFDWRGRNSQDVQFYARVKRLTGARVGVDRDNDVGHVGEKIYTMKEYYKLREEYRKQQKQTEVTENG